MRSAAPTQTAAMCRRPLSSTFIAVLKPTPSLPPIRLRGRHAAVLENDVAGVRAALAHLPVGLAEGEAGRAALDDEGRDAVRALVAGVGARHHGEDAGLGRVGDVALGPVQHVVVAVAHARVVVSDAASEPASGSVSANDAMISPEASCGR